MSTLGESAALHALRRCGANLLVAQSVVAELVGPYLLGVRQERSTELVAMIGDCVAFCQRLAMCVEGDLRADTATNGQKGGGR